MEKHTFGRKPQKKYKSLNNRCFKKFTDKATENGGMNSLQNWRNVRDKERWMLRIGRYHS